MKSTFTQGQNARASKTMWATFGVNLRNAAGRNVAIEHGNKHSVGRGGRTERSLKPIEIGRLIPVSTALQRGGGRDGSVQP